MKASNPGPYHGQHKSKSFFEGWYFKIDQPEIGLTLIVIVGIAMNANGEKEAFIQFGESNTKKPRYYRFDAAEFQASSHTFEVKLGPNYFSLDRLKLDLADLQMDLHLSHHRQWEGSPYVPNIMGPLSYFSHLDCHHNVLSLRNTVRGSMLINGTNISLNDAIGYIEKDWGKTFPKAHIWMQSNTLEQSDLSLSLAVGKMDFLKQSWRAHAAILQGEDGSALFASYRLHRFRFRQNPEGYRLTFRGSRYTLEISFNPKDTMPLVSPNHQGMKGIVEESLQSEILVQLKDRFQQKLLIDTQGTASVEIAGSWT